MDDHHLKEIKIACFPQ